MNVAERLEALGFDLSKPAPDGSWQVACSCCEALAINGLPCHETGCPNSKHECRGCDALIPMNQRYCGDCQ